MIVVLASIQLQGQILYEKQDSIIFEKYIKQMHPHKNLAISDLIVRTANFFIDKPYVAQTLEQADKEQLIINLREFDCTTFVESCISLTLTLKSDNPTFDTFSENLQKLRYRNGQIEGYTSRLHYMSDWIYENEQRNTFNNISETLGGTEMTKAINFMSTHANLYPHLKNNEHNVDKIKDIEEIITKREYYAVVPKSKIRSAEKDIESGDIVVFATKTEGLDYSHIGIAIKENNSLSFIHASSSKKRVISEPRNLQQYCHSSKGCFGMTILRIKEFADD